MSDELRRYESERYYSMLAWAERRRERCEPCEGTGYLRNVHQPWAVEYLQCDYCLGEGKAR